MQTGTQNRPRRSHLVQQQKDKKERAKEQKQEKGALIKRIWLELTHGAVLDCCAANEQNEKRTNKKKKKKRQSESNRAGPGAEQRRKHEVVVLVVCLLGSLDHGAEHIHGNLSLCPLKLVAGAKLSRVRIQLLLGSLQNHDSDSDHA